MLNKKGKQGLDFAATQKSLGGLLDIIKDKNERKETKRKTMKNVLHVLRLKNSAEEAMILDQYIDLDNEEGNFISSERSENIEIAYYFPLRNEKNVEFLVTHANYLEAKIQKSSGLLERSETVNDSLRFKHAVIKKDINIMQTRLIGMKKVYDSVLHAGMKAATTKSQAQNIETNINLKKHLIERMKEEYNEEYDKFYTKIETRETKKNIIVETLHQEVAKDLIEVVELEKVERAAREKVYKLNNEQRVHLNSDNFVIEILDQFEAFQMMMDKSGKLDVTPSNRKSGGLTTVFHHESEDFGSEDSAEVDQDLYIIDDVEKIVPAKDRKM